LSGGADGSNISDDDISGPALESRMQGLWALEKADLFNFLCIPPLIPAGEIGRKTREAGANYCKTRRALFIVDPPASWASTGAAISGVGSLMTKTPDAAMFFPRLRASDPLKGGAIADFAPCGAVAGVMARHRRDARRLAGAGRTASNARGRRRAFGRFDRRRHWQPQFLGRQLPARYASDRHGRVGRAYLQ
jgi:hypothetical protein